MRSAHAGLCGVVIIAMTGCAPPPEAPTELNELVRYMFREWPAEDPEVLAAGARNVELFLTDVDLSSSRVLDRSWEVSPLQEEDVSGIERPEGRSLEDLVGVTVGYLSRWDVVDHARVQVQADQRPFEPTAPDHYDRTFIDEDDPDCFVTRGCERLETVNDATRQNALMTITFQLFKNFRWVELDEGRWGFLSRSWISESSPGENDNTTLWQSYSDDLWLPAADGGTVRLQVIWSEVDVGIAAGPSVVAATLKSGTNGVLMAGDDAIEAQFYAD